MTIYEVLATTEYGFKRLGYTTDPNHREKNVGYVSIFLLPLMFREDFIEYSEYVKTGKLPERKQ